MGKFIDPEAPDELVHSFTTTFKMEDFVHEERDGRRRPDLTEALRKSRVGETKTQYAKSPKMKTLQSRIEELKDQLTAASGTDREERLQERLIEHEDRLKELQDEHLEKVEEILENDESFIPLSKLLRRVEASVAATWQGVSLRRNLTLFTAQYKQLITLLIDFVQTYLVKIEEIQQVNMAAM